MNHPYHTSLQQVSKNNPPYYLPFMVYVFQWSDSFFCAQNKDFDNEMCVAVIKKLFQRQLVQACPDQFIYFWETQLWCLQHKTAELYSEKQIWFNSNKSNINKLFPNIFKVTDLLAGSMYYVKFCLRTHKQTHINTDTNKHK